MKLTKSQFKQIIKEELDAAMLDAYIGNPTDLSMPEEVALHPQMIKARSAFWREKAEECEENNAAERRKCVTKSSNRFG